MGLFSSKKKTTVGTSVSRVIEDRMLPDSIKAGSIHAILKDQGLPEHMLEALVQGVGFKAERMYEYARKNYPLGLPSATYTNANEGLAAAETVLNQLEGTPVSVVYSRLSPPNTLHIGWMRLVSDYGYNPTTNTLVVGGKTVHLVDMVPCIPQSLADELDEEVMQQWGVSPRAGSLPDSLALAPGVGSVIGHSNLILDPNATDDYVLVTYGWETSTTDPFSSVTTVTPHKATLTIPITGVEDDEDYLHVCYLQGNVRKYWMYRLGSGTYPSLDALVDTPPQTLGQFFPFTYFRYNKASTTGNQASTVFQTSEKMLRYLGMDYLTVAEEINKNPDIDDVEQAMLVFAVPANTSNEIEQRYLFDFFNNMYLGTGNRLTSSGNAGIARLLGGLLGANAVPRMTTVVQDARFKMSISNAGIIKQRKAGTLGKVGSYHSGRTTTYRTQTYSVLDAAPVTVEVPVDTHYYRHQVSDGVYDELLVQDLRVQYHVWGKYAVTADDSDKILLIPLDHAITTQYNVTDRELLYARGLHFVFNSRVTVKVKWYQTGIFKIFMIVIAVVISIYTGFADGGSGIAAALGASGAAAIAINVIFTLVIGQLVSFAMGKLMPLFVKIFGEEIAMLVAVVIIIYGGYKILQAGSVKGLPWASEMLTVANGLVKAALDAKMEDLLGDYSDFQRYVQSQLETLEDAQKLLDTNNSHVLNPFVVFGESPTEYYNRTVHSGNIGVRGIDALTNYVELSLQLPEPHDTLRWSGA